MYVDSSKKEKIMSKVLMTIEIYDDNIEVREDGNTYFNGRIITSNGETQDITLMMPFNVVEDK